MNLKNNIPKNAIQCKPALHGFLVTAFLFPTLLYGLFASSEDTADNFAQKHSYYSAVNYLERAVYESNDAGDQERLYEKIRKTASQWLEYASTDQAVPTDEFTIPTRLRHLGYLYHNALALRLTAQQKALARKQFIRLLKKESQDFQVTASTSVDGVQFLGIEWALAYFRSDAEIMRIHAQNAAAGARFFMTKKKNVSGGSSAEILYAWLIARYRPTEIPAFLQAYAAFMKKFRFETGLNRQGMISGESCAIIPGIQAYLKSLASTGATELKLDIQTSVCSADLDEREEDIAVHYTVKEKQMRRVKVRSEYAGRTTTFINRHCISRSNGPPLCNEMSSGGEPVYHDVYEMREEVVDMPRTDMVRGRVRFDSGVFRGILTVSSAGVLKKIPFEISKNRREEAFSHPRQSSNFSRLDRTAELNKLIVADLREIVKAREAEILGELKARRLAAVRSEIQAAQSVGEEVRLDNAYAMLLIEGEADDDYLTNKYAIQASQKKDLAAGVPYKSHDFIETLKLDPGGERRDNQKKRDDYAMQKIINTKENYQIELGAQWIGIGGLTGLGDRSGFNIFAGFRTHAMPHNGIFFDDINARIGFGAITSGRIPEGTTAAVLYANAPQDSGSAVMLQGAWNLFAGIPFGRFGIYGAVGAQYFRARVGEISGWGIIVPIGVQTYFIFSEGTMLRATFWFYSFTSASQIGVDIDLPLEFIGFSGGFIRFSYYDYKMVARYNGIEIYNKYLEKDYYKSFTSTYLSVGVSF